MPSNDLSAFNVQMWSKAIISNVDQLNVMLPMTNRQYQGQFNRMGDTVNVRTLGHVTTKGYTKGETLDFQALAPTVEPFVISDAFYFNFEVDDIDEIQNDMNALNLYAGRAAVSASNKIEAKIMSAVLSAHANNQISAAGAAITLDSSDVVGTGIYHQFVKAAANLTRLDVPMSDRWAVIGPDDLSLIQRDTAHFIRASDLGDAVVRRGTVDGESYEVPGLAGEVLKFRVYVSNTIPTVAGARYLPYGQGKPIHYVSQLNTIETIRRQDTFANAMRGLVLHDVKVFAEESKMLGYIKAA